MSFDFDLITAVWFYTINFSLGRMDMPCDPATDKHITNIN